MTTSTHLNKARKKAIGAPERLSGAALELAVIVRNLPFGMLWAVDDHRQPGEYRGKCTYCHERSDESTADLDAARKLPINHKRDCLGVLACELLKRLPELDDQAWHEEHDPSTPTGRAMRDARIEWSAELDRKHAELLASRSGQPSLGAAERDGSAEKRFAAERCAGAAVLEEVPHVS